ncbi:sensor histidine kinase [Bifidobacterium xylocopae]|uniref:histidine kinase n=1 Tax=Bifidobacterium xylocopae TaxID=2493119 RepID=A0A366KFA2_9BIFI|nr:HAMP domain-containing sensor histidine kinase [Bifidobacterium xylocopae]RBP99912.1 two-component sensor histidine kinase [Bifidobacterium xylocopae]
MVMIVLLALAVVAALALAVGLIVLAGDLRRIIRDLEYINEGATNATVTTNTGFGPTRRLAETVNANLAQTRRLREQEFNQELRIRRMLTNLTHDIKTPLTVARGYVQLLGERAGEAGADAAPGAGTGADAWRKAASSLDSVDYYLHYLMDFTLIQEKSGGLSLSQVDLSALVQDDLFAAFDQLTARGVTVEPSIEPGIRLTSDETLLHRIVQNLIGNWLKYASGMARIRLGAEGKGQFVLVLENETDQPYVPADRLRLRFATTADRQPDSDGTGLGLSIVASLAETLGGRMELETRPGHFRVTIILCSQEAPVTG